MHYQRKISAVLILLVFQILAAGWLLAQPTSERYEFNPVRVRPNLLRSTPLCSRRVPVATAPAAA